MSATDVLGAPPKGKAPKPRRRQMTPPNRKAPVPPRRQMTPPNRTAPVPPRRQMTPFDKLVETLVTEHWQLTTYDANRRAAQLLDGGVNTPHDLRKLSKSELRKFGFRNIDMIDMPTDVGVDVLATKASNGIITIKARFYNRGVGEDEGSQDTVIELPPQGINDLTEVTLVDVGSEFELLEPDYPDTLCDPDYWPDNGYSVEYQVRCKSETRPSMSIGQVRIQTSTDTYLIQVSEGLY